MPTLEELSERIKQLERRVRILENQISGDAANESLSEKLLNEDSDQ